MSDNIKKNKDITEKFIPVNEPLLTGNEKKYLIQCIETGWISSEGDFVKQFEEKFAKKVKRKYAISVTNGSAALDAAVAAINVRKNDEVIMPAFTIISCGAAIVRAGAKPVLIDCDPYDFNMKVSDIESRITSKTRAIMVVHIYGLPVDMDPLLELAKKYNLKVIEDAAEMHGQEYKGKPCGSFGDISTFSFYPNKLVTTGEGGMIVTDNEEIAEKCRNLRNLYFDKDRRYIHADLGWNLRMTNIQAALGLAQLEQLDKFILKKRWMGKLYTELLLNVKNIQLPIGKKDYAENIYWVYPIVLKKDTELNAIEAIQILKSNNIGARHFFWPMHKQPVFLKMDLFKDENYPESENLAEKGFYIPSGLALEEEQIIRVAEVIEGKIN
ncbi:MAG: DegT/DnrJ/EryC1/StrS family aminotransferase [Candidatus Humimicrobiaceae bacterium]